MQNNPPSEQSSFSRRLFGKNAIVTAAMTILPPAALAETGAISVSVQHLGAKPEGLSDDDWSEVYARYSNLLRVYGSRLSTDEKRRLINILTTNQRMLVSIRSFEVQNGDPSACTLRLKV
ncbi:MAG: hypothetical protein ABI286_04565 [Edaphobacter sp.]